MSTDRELLELAAKAAGIKLADEVDSYLPGSRALWVVGPGGRDVVWQPLGDDGDALRLAVKLQMNVDVGQRIAEAAILCNDERIGAEEACNDDPFAATRRAIVRAAAEIGRSLP